MSEYLYASFISLLHGTVTREEAPFPPLSVTGVVYQYCIADSGDSFILRLATCQMFSNCSSATSFLSYYSPSHSFTPSPIFYSSSLYVPPHSHVPSIYKHLGSSCDVANELTTHSSLLLYSLSFSLTPYPHPLPSEPPPLSHVLALILAFR